jgi:hypothetical protein
VSGRPRMRAWAAVAAGPSRSEREDSRGGPVRTLTNWKYYPAEWPPKQSGRSSSESSTAYRNNRQRSGSRGTADRSQLRRGRQPTAAAGRSTAHQEVRGPPDERDPRCASPVSASGRSNKDGEPATTR